MTNPTHETPAGEIARAHAQAARIDAKHARQAEKRADARTARFAARRAANHAQAAEHAAERAAANGQTGESHRAAAHAEAAARAARKAAAAAPPSAERDEANRAAATIEDRATSDWQNDQAIEDGCAEQREQGELEARDDDAKFGY